LDKLSDYNSPLLKIQCPNNIDKIKDN
jgi:hypothetical protein